MSPYPVLRPSAWADAPHNANSRDLRTDIVGILPFPSSLSDTAGLILALLT